MKLVHSTDKPIKPKKIKYCPECGSSVWTQQVIGCLGQPRPLRKLCCTYCLANNKVIYDDNALNVRPMINRHTYKTQKVISSNGDETYCIKATPFHVKDENGDLIKFKTEKDALIYIENLIAKTNI